MCFASTRILGSAGVQRGTQSHPGRRGERLEGVQDVRRQDTVSGRVMQSGAVETAMGRVMGSGTMSSHRANAHCTTAATRGRAVWGALRRR